MILDGCLRLKLLLINLQQNHLYILLLKKCKFIENECITRDKMTLDCKYVATFCFPVLK